MGADIRTVGVVGAGTMGSGIAQLALEAGHEVWLSDLDALASRRAEGRIRDGLRRRAVGIGIHPDALDEWVDTHTRRLRLASATEAFAGACDLVIEAASEDLGVKRSIFGALDRTAAPDAILATNTSALSVGAIASATRRPGRVVGLHFFNPAPVMRLVEVIATATTDKGLVDRLADLMGRWGRTAVRSTDSPGFIVNRVNRPFTLESLAAIEAGVTSPAAIDRAFRTAAYPMGPFELMDLIGLDINLAVTRALHAAAIAAGDPLAERFHPSALQERLVTDGRLGRKTDGGFYAPGQQPATEAEGTDDPSATAVVERVELAIINEAYRSTGEHVASAPDVDTALRLGAGHPLGPFERADRMGGPAMVLARLRAMADRGPRFVPAHALLADQ